MKESLKSGVFRKILISVVLTLFGAAAIFLAGKYRSGGGIESFSNQETDFSNLEYLESQTDEDESSFIVKKHYKYDSTLKMSGSKGFKRQITEALRLIWLYDKPSFRFVRKYIYEIKSSNSTEFLIENGTPIIVISDKNAYKSVTWCAGIIAHHTFHAYARVVRNRGKKNKIIPPVPGTKSGKVSLEGINPLAVDFTGLETILAIEDKASDFQMRLLGKIGAPKTEINLIKNRNPKDFSISHDGSYSVNP